VLWLPMPAFRSKATTDARPRRVTTWQGNHKTARNETAPAPGRVRLGGAVRTTLRHLLTIFQEGFPCCLAFSFKNALRRVRRGSLPTTMLVPTPQMNERLDERFQ